MTDKSAMMEKLDAHHLLLDGSAAPGTAWCFRSLPMSFSLGGKKVPYFTSYNFKEQALRNF